MTIRNLGVYNPKANGKEVDWSVYCRTCPSADINTPDAGLKLAGTQQALNLKKAGLVAKKHEGEKGRNHNIFLQGFKRHKVRS